MKDTTMKKMMGFILAVRSGKWKNMKNCLLSIFVNVLTAGCLFADPLAVESPDGRTSAFFEVKDGALLYSIKHGESLIIEASELRIFSKSKTSIVDSSVTEMDSNWSPIYGQFSKIRDHCRELSLAFQINGIPVRLQCRAYDTGIGFRFVLSEESKGQKMAYFSGYNLVAAVGHYYPNGERGVTGPVALNEQKKIPLPLVTELKDGSFVAFLESDLYSAPEFSSMVIFLDPVTKAVVALSSAVSQGAGQLTPWRVIIFGQTAGDLLVNTVALNVAAPCKLEDASWIKPGKSLWDWRIHDYYNGEFAYGINTQSYIRLIDFAAAQGIEYLTIDSGWYTKAESGTMTVAEAVDIEKVMRYAKDKGVGIILYYDRKKGNYGDDLLFSHYAGLGASGMKYGFMGNKADFTREAINAAAKNKLLISFHDGPCPMTGVERTMPNLVTREYCHAQQDSRRAFTPESFLKMAMVNALTGPLDQANCNFGINSINAGERAKGPSIKNSYISTVTSEIARTLVVFSGVITLPDAPEEYMKKSDLFEFVKNMPATWDDTRVLNNKIGEYITIARRTGDTWYVGSVNNEKARTLEITLDFLEPACSYEAALYQDASNAHGVNNPEAYEIKTATIKRGDVIRAEMVLGGGHAMRLRQIK